MIDWTNSLSPLAVIAALAGLEILFVLVSLLFIYLCHAFSVNQTSATPYPPYMAVVITLFSLIVALYTNSVYTQKKLEAKNFTILETSYSQLADILKADDLCYANGTQLLRDYVKQVNDEDMVTKNISYGPRKSDLILSVLLTNLGKTSNSFSRTGSGIISSLLADIRKARAEVRWITDHQTDVFSWYIMLALGLIAHLSIAAAHIDRARGAIIAILLFSTANSVVYWYIINLENPNFSEDVSRHRIFLQDFSNENIGPVSCKSTVEKGSANVNIGTKQAR